MQFISTKNPSFFPFRKRLNSLFCNNLRMFIAQQKLLPSGSSFSYFYFHSEYAKNHRRLCKLNDRTAQTFRLQHDTIQFAVG